MDSPPQQPHGRGIIGWNDSQLRVPFHRRYTTNLPRFSANPMTAFTPALKAKKSASILSLKITPFSGMREVRCSG